MKNNTENLKRICLEEIFNQRTIIYDRCVMPGQITIVNGKKIYLRPITYIDLPISSIRYLNAVSEYIFSLQGSLRYEALCGVATQGVPYVFAVSEKYNIPAIYLRKKKQLYGTNSFISGKLLDKSKVLIVDNLVYSGGTMNFSIEKLLEANYNVAGICTVVKFETSFNHLNKEYDLKYLVTVKEIYDYLIKKNYFPKQIVNYVQLFIQDQTLFHSGSKLYLEYLYELDKLRSL